MLSQRQGAPYKPELFWDSRVPAEHRAGKPPWVPFGRCQRSLSHQGCPPGWEGARMTVRVRDKPILPRQPGWREGSRAAPAFPCPLPAPRRAASGTGEPTAPKTPSTIESKVRNKTVLLEQS